MESVPVSVTPPLPTSLAAPVRRGGVLIPSPPFPPLVPLPPPPASLCVPRLVALLLYKLLMTAKPNRENERAWPTSSRESYPRKSTLNLDFRYDEVDGSEETATLNPRQWPTLLVNYLRLFSFCEYIFRSPSLNCCFYYQLGTRLVVEFNCYRYRRIAKYMGV